VTPKLIETEKARLASSVDCGEMSSREAVEAAFALGVECERLDTMHRACEEYSRARAARDSAFKERSKSNPPPAGKP
jgi:hypothetical protein